MSLTYKALRRFQELFRNGPYRHRRSTQGNEVAALVVQDLFELSSSPKLVEGVQAGLLVVGPTGGVKGKVGRRGDVMFGRIVPGTRSKAVPGRIVPNGLVAVAQLGIEVKILAQRGAMLKQIERVINDLTKQAHTFRKHADCLAVGIIGVNYSESYLSYEGERTYASEDTPPAAKKESDEVSRRIEEENKAQYDELLILKFKATNRAPFPFHWLNQKDTYERYASALARLSNLYQQRF